MRTVIPVMYFPTNWSKIQNFTVISRLQFGFLAFPFSPRPLPPSSCCLSIFRASECHRSPHPAVNFDACLMYALLCSLTSRAHADGRSVRPFPAALSRSPGNLPRVTQVCARKWLSFFLSKVFCGSFNDWMRKRKLSICRGTFPVSGGNLTSELFCTCWKVGRCVAQGARLKTHAHSNPWKRYRTSLHVCLSCHIGVSGPAAARTTHHVWFISTCLQNNKTWQFDSEPIAALQTS